VALVIGFTAALGAGKDVAGQHLVSKHGFTRVAFADPLKQEVMRILPRTCREMIKKILASRHGGIHTLQFSDEQLDEAVRREIYIFKHEPFRALLQEWGTDFRRTEDPEYWIKKWRAAVARVHAGEGPVVATDCRFPNEAQSVKALGGYVVRIERPGHQTDKTHISETAMAEWPADYTLVNDGTLDDLHQTLDRWLDHLYDREITAAK
jgi:hypothetical protein